MVYEFNEIARDNLNNGPLNERFITEVCPGRVPQKAHLLHLIGAPGSGLRRLALQFAHPARSIIWISEKWNLYAPLLWKLAEERGIKLLGLECPERKRWRMLWRELLEAQVFDGWILDNLRLTPGESSFLQKLTRRFSIRILALDERPRALFQNRAHIYLSHHSYRVQWMKGAPPTPQYFASPFLEIFAHSSQKTVVQESWSKRSRCEARRSEHRNVVMMPLEERSDDRNKADGPFSTAPIAPTSWR